MFLRFLAACVAVSLLPLLALAQETVDPGPSVDFTSLIEPLLALLVAVATALLGLASRYISKKTGVEVNLRNNAIIDGAIERGIGFARSRLEARAVVPVKSELVAIAAGYVITGAPKALEYFQITPERLKDMIEARLAPPETPAAP